MLTKLLKNKKFNIFAYSWELARFDCGIRAPCRLVSTFLSMYILPFYVLTNIMDCIPIDVIGAAIRICVLVSVYILVDIDPLILCLFIHMCLKNLLLYQYLPI